MKRNTIDFALGDMPQSQIMNSQPNWEGAVKKDHWAVASASYELDVNGQWGIINLSLLRVYDPNGDLMPESEMRELESGICEQIEFEWSNK